jgi:hypothetical protein
VPVAEREAFNVRPAERGATPEAGRLDPRTAPEQSS